MLGKKTGTLTLTLSHPMGEGTGGGRFGFSCVIVSTNASVGPPSPIRWERAGVRVLSSVHLAQHDVHAAQNDHDVGDQLIQAHVFQHR